MQLTEFRDAEELLKEYGEALQGKEAVCHLILYNALSCSENRANEQVSYGVVFSEADMQLLFCKYPVNGLALCAVNKENMSEAVHKLADHLLADNYAIDELRGSNDVCVSFMEYYKQLTGSSFAKLSGMDIMELRRPNDIKQTEGIQRLARPDETQLIIDWIIEARMEAKTSEMDYEAVMEMVARYIKEGRVYIYERDNTAVSMVIKERTVAGGVILSNVYTPVEHRGQGYAAANVYNLSKAMLEEGYDFCVMSVDKRNPLSVRSYEKTGYVKVDDIYEFKLFPSDEV